MTLLRTWILSVTACAMVIAAAEALMPDGAVKRVGKLTGGLILVLGLLQPLVKLDYDDWLDDLPAQIAGAVTQEDLEGAAYAPMKSIIERELSAYIVDKGAQLGVTCTAQVVCETGEDGVPIPTRTTITGAMTPAQKEAMIRCVTQELAIPRSGQIYRNEEVP